MEDKNCGILLKYLKSILSDPAVEKPDLRELEGPFLQLGQYMERLQRQVEELKVYSRALALGNLSEPAPSKENVFCEELMKLHENLNHLTWQAQRVASGDYTQHISYMGEFSEAFNSMTGQLKIREAMLQEETKKLHARAEVIEAYNELLMEMTRKRNEWVMVVDALDQNVVYCNKSVNEGNGEVPLCDQCQCRLDFQRKILEWKAGSQWVWEFTDRHGVFFSINSFPVEWRGRESFVHIIADVTKQRQEKDDLKSKVYDDAAFGTRNRRFFLEYMEQILREKKTVTLCYLDLDGLKYVNDTFGHQEGDRYIKAFVEVVQRHFRRGDILARVGGDEFALVLPGNLEQLAASKLENARSCFSAENKQKYPVSFSYGVSLINGETNTRTLSEILECVDVAMYEYKRKMKEARG